MNETEIAQDSFDFSEYNTPRESIMLMDNSTESKESEKISICQERFK